MNVAQFEVDEKIRKEQIEQSEAEVGIFVLLDTQGSGFIKQGTERLPEPIELAYPGWRKIMHTNVIEKNGKRIKTRHILGCEHITIAEQEKANEEPNFNQDFILVKNGQLIVSNEGRQKGLFKFLTEGTSHYDKCPFRVKNAPAVFTRIFPEKEKEGDFEQDFHMAEAIAVVYQLARKNDKGEWTYDKVKLTAYGKLFNVLNDTAAGQVNSLLAVAKLKPKEFLQTIKAFEGQVMIPIDHAEQIGLITFEEGRVVYEGTNEVILTYSSKLDKIERKETLAGYFQSQQGAEAYQVFRAKMDMKQNKQL